MKIKFICPVWGNTEEFDLFCEKVACAGFDGIDYAIDRNASQKELDRVWNIAEKNNLKIIAQHYDTYEADFAEHLDQLGNWFEKIKSYPVLKINSQTGKDFFSFEQNKQLIDLATASGLNVLHETHRNKFAFAAHITKTYLERLPDLKLTLDISHWVCVAESFLEDQPEAVNLAIERTEHIHARVGYPEGPQVPDPRAPEWGEALKKHLDWWDRVVDRKRREGETLTIAPEFGPFPYMVYLPGTKHPIADQWQINEFMMNLLRRRYSK